MVNVCFWRELGDIFIILKTHRALCIIISLSDMSDLSLVAKNMFDSFVLLTYTEQYRRHVCT